tara:strand:+ start:61 stop:372 length:312 start_codon:yes stop_codon:yes gene_type:complete
MGGVAKIIRKAVSVIAPKPKVVQAVQKVQTQAKSVKSAAAATKAKAASGAGGSLYGTNMNMTGAEGVEEEAQTAKTALGGGMDMEAGKPKKKKGNEVKTALAG